MEKLNPVQEEQIKIFRLALIAVEGPDDMFPPDIGVREPAPLKPGPNLPKGAGAVAVKTTVYSQVCV